MPTRDLMPDSKEPPSISRPERLGSISPHRDRTESVADTNAPNNATKADTKLDDFGEKLGGARKDLSHSYKQEWSDNDIAK